VVSDAGEAQKNNNKGYNETGGNNHSNSKESGHLMQSRGLFPQPLLPVGRANANASCAFGKIDDNFMSRSEEANAMAYERNEKVVSRFRFLGRLMAKALLDGKHVPLPLAAGFFVLLKNRLGYRENNSQSQLLPITALGLVEGGSSEEGMSGLERSSTTSTSMGIVATLYRWWRRSLPEDWENIKNLLENADLKFVDPSIRIRKKKSMEESESERKKPIRESLKNIHRGNDSVDDKVSLHGGTIGAINVVEGKEKVSIDDEDDFEKKHVLKPGCSQIIVNEYAVRASELGYSQSEIDADLDSQGISKMQRWKAIKASQKIRTDIALEKALQKEKEQVNDPLVIASELIPHGASIQVTTENVDNFLQTVTAWWLEHGVVRQADAFREGLNDVLGVQGSNTLLYNFSPTELRKMLCGKQEVQWKEDDPMLGCLLPMGGYTEDSPPIKMLVQVLKEMNMKERSQFLSFVTSQPRVPLSGLPEIKVYPPMMDCLQGIILEEDDPNDGIIHVDDEVELSPDYVEWDDAAHGPLRLGDTALVAKVEGRALVQGWWYNLRALRRVAQKSHNRESDKTHDGAGAAAAAKGNGGHGEDNDNDNDSSERSFPKSSWFKPGDTVHTQRARAIIDSWHPEENKIVFSQKFPVHGIFTKGTRVETSDARLPVLRVGLVLEQPEAVQLPPYLRPKATTCAKTMYLPDGYDDYKHMLRIFREAFEDAKLGGIND